MKNNEVDLFSYSESNKFEKYKFFIKSPGREIVPCEDEDKNILAKKRLDEILIKYRNNIPKRFIDNWERVKLYSPKGVIETASGLILDIKDGSYDLKNKLNDMTGKEWTLFSCSWFIFNALKADLNEERAISSNSEDHPATFSPTMISNFVRFFTKENEAVLDPFAGIGSTLVACQRTNRIGFGIELNKKYYDIILKRVPAFKNNVFNADSTRIKELTIPPIDFCISSPPYWDVLNRSTDGFEKDRKDKGLDVKYSNNENDLGNISDYDKFVDVLAKVYLDIFSILKNGAYIVIIVKNIKKQGKLYPLAWDLAKALSSKYTLKDEKIWIQDKIALSPYGYPHTWASNILHHYCIILRKEL